MGFWFTIEKARMSEPEESFTSSSFFWEKIWPQRLPLIFLLFGFAFLFLAFYFFAKNNSGDKSVEIKKPETVSASRPLSIKIDISGAVEKPGVYEMQKDDRIEDAIIKAGGFKKDADAEYVSKMLNLAQKLVDGTKIYIPFQEEKPDALKMVQKTSENTSQYNNSTLTNINSASISELEKLSGVGLVTAQKIIDSRPYGSIEELLIKKTVGKSVFEKIKDKISVY